MQLTKRWNVDGRDSKVNLKVNHTKYNYAYRSYCKKYMNM